jgi:hypothetical protein
MKIVHDAMSVALAPTERKCAGKQCGEAVEPLLCLSALSRHSYPLSPVRAPFTRSTTMREPDYRPTAMTTRVGGW